MTITILIGIWTLFFLVRLVVNTKKKLMTFDESVVVLRESFESQRARNIPQVPSWLIILLFGFYILYYMIAGAWVNQIWFTVLSVIQVVLTAFDARVAKMRFDDKDNIDYWKPVIQDSFAYKLVCTVILEYVYTVSVSIIVICRLFF